MLILTFLLYLFSAAKASEGQSGAVLPGALPIEEGGGSVGLATGQFIWGNSSEPTLAAEISYGLRENLSIHGSIGPHVIETTSPVDGSTLAGTSAYDGLMIYGALRHTLRERSGFRLSAYLATFAHTLDQPSIILAPGFAIEGGWKRIRLDFSAVPQALHYDADPLLETLRTIEIPAEGGISFYFGENHAIRAGGADPSLSYRYTTEHFYGEIGHSQPEFSDRMWNAKMGARF